MFRYRKTSNLSISTRLDSISPAAPTFSLPLGTLFLDRVIDHVYPSNGRLIQALRCPEIPIVLEVRKVQLIHLGEVSVWSSSFWLSLVSGQVRLLETQLRWPSHVQRRLVKSRSSSRVVAISTPGQFVWRDFDAPCSPGSKANFTPRRLGDLNHQPLAPLVSESNLNPGLDCRCNWPDFFPNWVPTRRLSIPAVCYL